MHKEVLLDFVEAKTHKKTAYRESLCASGKKETPLRGKYNDELILKKNTKIKKLSHFLFIDFF